MRRISLLILVALLWGITLPARAVWVKDLYQAKIPVTSQNTASETQAMPQAVKQVLIKVSGNSKIMNNPALADHLSTAQQYVEEVGYITPDAATDNTPYLLLVTFDAKSIDQWLRDAGATLWGQNRPLLLAWVDYQGELLSSDSKALPAVLLKQAMQRRGVPLLLPVLDLTDLNQVSVADVDNKQMAKLTTAAKRYASDALIIGHMSQSPTGITSQWTLATPDKEWEFTVTGTDLATVINQATDQMIDTLAARYAVIATNTVQQDLTIKVTGVTQAMDLNHLIQYLTHLPAVANVAVTQIQGPDVWLKVSLRSSTDAFKQALAQNHFLQPLTDTTQTVSLVYQWNP